MPGDQCAPEDESRRADWLGLGGGALGRGRGPAHQPDRVEPAARLMTDDRVGPHGGAAMRDDAIDVAPGRRPEPCLSF